VGLVTKVIRYLGLLLWWLLLPQAIASVESDNLEGIRSETVGGDIQPERPKSFQRVTRLDSSIRSDMRYASDQNFVGRPIAGYLAPVCYLANPAALALVEVHQDYLRKGMDSLCSIVIGRSAQPTILCSGR